MISLNTRNPVFADTGTPFLTALSNWLGMLTTPLKVKLWTAGPTPTPAWVAADYTVASFTGYADGSITPADNPRLTSSGQAYADAANVLFTATAAPTPPGVSVLGYFILDGGNAPLICEQFETPVTFVNLGDTLDLLVLFPFMFFGYDLGSASP